MSVFFNAQDRSSYLALLDEQGRRYGLRYLSYCLMTNHVHLLVVPETEESLPRGVGEAHRLYTKSIN